MSWFSVAPAQTGPNFKPLPTSGDLFGALAPTDTDWKVETSKGFRTETQSWYAILADGSWIMFQVIFSVTGIMLMPASINFVFKRYDPKTKDVIWKSVALTKFKAEGKSITSDQVTIKHTGSTTTEEKYSISANLNNEVQIAVDLTRPAEIPGFKVGAGPDGGVSFFGHDAAKPDGIVWHKFLPVLVTSGSLILKGSVISADGEAMFSHAVQGMQPNLIARRWNFAFFTSSVGAEKRARAIMMEFETNDEHGVDGKGNGRNKVNVGAVVLDNKISFLTSQLHTPTPAKDMKPSTTSQATHISPVADAFTGYTPPSRVRFEWAGTDAQGGELKAWTENATGSGNVGEDGLIEKVDVLGEIPYLIKKVVQVVASTKPYIYQHVSDATLHVTLPGASEETLIEGKIFDELTFIS